MLDNLKESPEQVSGWFGRGAPVSDRRARRARPRHLADAPRGVGDDGRRHPGVAAVRLYLYVVDLLPVGAVVTVDVGRDSRAIGA